LASNGESSNPDPLGTAGNMDGNFNWDAMKVFKRFLSLGVLEPANIACDPHIAVRREKTEYYTKKNLKLKTFLSSTEN